MWKLACASMISLIGLGARYGHQGRLTYEANQLFNKAQLYHLSISKPPFYTDVALMVLGLSSRIASSRYRVLAAGSFCLALLLFCAPMYHLAITNNKSAFSKLMPVGGISMMLGWGVLFFA